MVGIKKIARMEKKGFWCGFAVTNSAGVVFAVSTAAEPGKVMSDLKCKHFFLCLFVGNLK